MATEVVAILSGIDIIIIYDIEADIDLITHRYFRRTNFLIILLTYLIAYLNLMYYSKDNYLIQI